MVGGGKGSQPLWLGELELRKLLCLQGLSQDQAPQDFLSSLGCDEVSQLCKDQVTETLEPAQTALLPQILQAANPTGLCPQGGS